MICSEVGFICVNSALICFFFICVNTDTFSGWFYLCQQCFVLWLFLFVSTVLCSVVGLCQRCSDLCFLFVSTLIRSLVGFICVNSVLFCGCFYLCQQCCVLWLVCVNSALFCSFCVCQH